MSPARRKRCRAFRKLCKVVAAGGTIRDYDGISALLDGHPDWTPDWTLLPEVVVDSYGTRGLGVETADRGTLIVCPRKVAFGDNAESRARDLWSVMREVVRPDIDMFRQLCGCTGDEVDHVPPTEFRVVARWFLESHGQPAYRPGRDGRMFPSEHWARAWRDYHREHAVLQCLSPEEHARVTRERERARAMEV